MGQLSLPFARRMTVSLGSQSARAMTGLGGYGAGREVPWALIDSGASGSAKTAKGIRCARDGIVVSLRVAWCGVDDTRAAGLPPAPGGIPFARNLPGECCGQGGGTMD